MPLHQQDLSGALRAVGIFGPGLIGGSLGLALESKFPDLDVRYWARPGSLERARERFPCATDDAAAAVAGADLVVLCTPVGAMPAIARRIRGELGAECVVTDAGSTKSGICRILEEILGARFVGSHPMAGSEQSGAGAARPDLFEGALCLVTPSGAAAAPAIDRVERFWQLAGCRTARTTPEEHDRLVARASHLPHAVAAVLASAVSREMPEALRVAAGGFRDTTRIAGGDPAMWAEIFMENRGELLAALDGFGEELGLLRRLLGESDRSGLLAYLAGARAVRARLG